MRPRPRQGSMNQCTGVSEEGKKRLIWNRVWGLNHWSQWLESVLVGQMDLGQQRCFNVARPHCIPASLDVVNSIPRCSLGPGVM